MTIMEIKIMTDVKVTLETDDETTTAKEMQPGTFGIARSGVSPVLIGQLVYATPHGDTLEFLETQDTIVDRSRYACIKITPIASLAITVRVS